MTWGCHRTVAFPNASKRGGAVVVELILALPILITALLTVVQFGYFFVRMQQVSLACRVGAEEASQTGGLPTMSGAPIPTNILDAIDKQLQSSGISRCRVRLEHNVAGPQIALVSPTVGACNCGPTTNLTTPPPRPYVRLTICVPLTEVMPNCLAGFGFDISDPSKVAEGTTIFRYEI